MKATRYFIRLRNLWPLCFVGFAAVVLSLAGGASSPALRYERSLILEGEWWRLLTGQLVHLGVSHLLLNLAGLVLIGWIFAPGLRAAQWLWLLGASWAGIDVAFLVFEQKLSWYVGLSGILHGLLLGAAVVDRGFAPHIRIMLIVLVLAKLGWEQWVGALPMTAEAAGGPVVVDAHLYGGIAGLLTGMVLWVRGRGRSV